MTQTAKFLRLGAWGAVGRSMRFIISVRGAYVPSRRETRGRNLLKFSRVIKHARRRLSRDECGQSLFACLSIWPISSVLYQGAAVI